MRNHAAVLLAAASLLLAACGGGGHGMAGGASDDAMQIAHRIGCANPEQNTEVIGVREEIGCALTGGDATIDTYSSVDQQQMTGHLVGEFAGGFIVTGDLWTVNVPTRALADQVQHVLGGTIS